MLTRPPMHPRTTSVCCLPKYQALSLASHHPTMMRKPLYHPKRWDHLVRSAHCVRWASLRHKTVLVLNCPPNHPGCFRHRLHMDSVSVTMHSTLASCHRLHVGSVFASLRSTPVSYRRCCMDWTCGNRLSKPVSGHRPKRKGSVFVTSWGFGRLRLRPRLLRGKGSALNQWCSHQYQSRRHYTDFGEAPCHPSRAPPRVRWIHQD